MGYRRLFRSAAFALTMVLGMSLLGCDGGSDGSSPQPARPAPTSPANASPGPDDGALSDDEIADIENELDAIDQLLDDLDAELRSD